MRHFKSSTLKILVDENNLINESNIDQIPGVILFDETSIASEIAKLSETDPFFARRNLFVFSESVTRRIAKRLAGELSSQWGAPADLIEEAIYFHLWTEMLTIIPVHRLARSIAQRARKCTVLINLPTLNLNCMELFLPNQLEPLILCWALQRRGCDVYLLYKGRVTGSDIILTLNPSSFVFGPSGPGLDGEVVTKGCSILAAEGMRGVDLAIKEANDPIILSGTHVMEALPFHPTRFLMRPEDKVASISFVLRKRRRDFIGWLRRTFQRDRVGIKSLERYSTRWPEDPLSSYIRGFFGQHFGAILRRCQSFVMDAGIKKAYVCDHLFFGSAILAHAVKKQGGAVTLWPHSANPHTMFRRGEYFDEVVVLTQGTKDLWSGKFPSKPVRVCPQIMFPPQKKAKAYDSSAPLTIILFGQSHSLVRFPLLRLESHIKTYRRFFSLHHADRDFVRLIYKPRDYRESASWLSNYVLTSSQNVEIEERPATQLDYPNMIFATINYGSTALLEGIACAVPCVIVREQNVTDYVILSDGIVPTGNAEFIWSVIKQCRDKEYYNSLLQKQISWFTNQTLSD
jgi:hypothetical protein